MLFFSCGSPVSLPVDRKSAESFHDKFRSDTFLIDNKVNLFLDYSTCVSEAVRSSMFFSRIRPRLTGLNPSLFSIKGPEIKFVTDDKDLVNEELNKIEETQFADIAGACRLITDGNEQALLITDGELWSVGAGERTDLAYLKDSFIKWLSKGFVIYIFAEDYDESYHGGLYSKKRFYFIFTDESKSNNVYNELNKAFAVSPLNSHLKLRKLSYSDLKRKGTLTVFPDLDYKLITNEKFTAFEIFSPWADIDEFVLNGKNPDDDSAIAGGNYLLRGLTIEPDSISAFSYPEIDIKVYNVTDKYMNSEGGDLSNSESNNMFILDKDLYHRTGEVGIKLAEAYYNDLNDKSENFIRIDLVATESIKRVDRNDFEWKSISKEGNNSSVYESILQTVDNNLIDPATSHRPLFTIYLKTPAL